MYYKYKWYLVEQGISMNSSLDRILLNWFLKESVKEYWAFHPSGDVSLAAANRPPS